MNTRNAIVELLRAGHSDRAIARQVHVRNTYVGEIRAQLGLPAHKPGPTPAGSYEDLFWRHAQPTDDGHWIWPNATANVRIGHEGPKQSARRIAFRIRYGRDPEGQVRPGCGVGRCVHPEHVEDQPMREQYAAIFGEVAA
jgi:hypothetical protein